MTKTDELLAVLSRIAEALERGELRASRDFASERREMERKALRFSMMVESDKRFPGLKDKIYNTRETLPISDAMKDWLLDDSHDGVAVAEFLTSHISHARRIYIADDETAAAELSKIEAQLFAKNRAVADELLSNALKGAPEQSE